VQKSYCGTTSALGVDVDQIDICDQINVTKFSYHYQKGTNRYMIEITAEYDSEDDEDLTMVVMPGGTHEKTQDGGLQYHVLQRCAAGDNHAPNQHRHFQDHRG
jgi:hypothetical protein